MLKPFECSLAFKKENKQICKGCRAAKKLQSTGQEPGAAARPGGQLGAGGQGAWGQGRGGPGRGLFSDLPPTHVYFSNRGMAISLQTPVSLGRALPRGRRQDCKGTGSGKLGDETVKVLLVKRKKLEPMSGITSQ